LEIARCGIEDSKKFQQRQTKVVKSLEHLPE